ncbi:MAG: LysR family transcriptional regulator, partial [Pseudomonadota bacterium]
MERPVPPLAWFTAFECAARHLSFTAAAGELNLTQSAISQHVRSLERRLGRDLFVRKHRSIALTDEGRRLLPTVTQSIGALREAAHAFDVPATKRILKVSASASIAHAYIVPRVDAFLAERPDWSLHLTTRLWPDEFLGSSADVEIRFGPVGQEPSLGRGEMTVIAAPKFAELNPPPTKPADIAALPLVQVLGTSDNWQAWARHVGYDGEMNVVCSVESHGMAVDCARAGIGVAYTSRLIAAPDIAEGKLIHLTNDEYTAIDGYLIRLGDNENRATSAAFAG